MYSKWIWLDAWEWLIEPQLRDRRPAIDMQAQSGPVHALLAALKCGEMSSSDNRGKTHHVVDSCHSRTPNSRDSRYGVCSRSEAWMAKKAMMDRKKNNRNGVT